MSDHTAHHLDMVDVIADKLLEDHMALMAENKKYADRIEALEAERDSYSEFLKEGETPRDRMIRYALDIERLLLRQAKLTTERDAMKAALEKIVTMPRSHESVRLAQQVLEKK